MQPPFPSLTATWHNDTYAAISPTRPELSMAGKTVVITGAGGAIGRETATAFALAGAKKIILLGQTAAALEETAALLPRSVSTSVHQVNVCDMKSMKSIAAQSGTWDVLILAAGSAPAPSPVASADFQDWWGAFEVNTKGVVVSAQAFLPTRNESKSTILAIASGLSAAFPASLLPGSSSYAASKLALTKAMEFLAVEHENVFAASVHPGIVDTAIFRKVGGRAEAFPMDQVQLPAHFLVWMASAQAEFLKGRMVWANWDVNELEAQADAIRNGQSMTVGLVGWPYQPSA